MGHALATSAFGFGVARFFLGLGESGNFPAAVKTTAEWFPQRERSLATGIFNSGANLGAMLAPALLPIVALKFGWRAGFLTTGFFSAAWIRLVACAVPPACGATAAVRGGAGPHCGRRRRGAHQAALAQAARLPPALGLCRG